MSQVREAGNAHPVKGRQRRVRRSTVLLWLIFLTALAAWVLLRPAHHPPTRADHGRPTSSSMTTPRRHRELTAPAAATKPG
ncbi:MAG TPA: hypothetical protein VGM14_09615 [Streptosporangiaceae bacterium]